MNLWEGLFLQKWILIGPDRARAGSHEGQAVTMIPGVGRSMGCPLDSQEKLDSVAQKISDTTFQKNTSPSAMEPGTLLVLSLAVMGQVLCHLSWKDLWTARHQFFCNSWVHLSWSFPEPSEFSSRAGRPDEDSPGHLGVDGPE